MSVLTKKGAFQDGLGEVWLDLISPASLHINPVCPEPLHQNYGLQKSFQEEKNHLNLQFEKFPLVPGKK
jgi:hypothetical protein